jgi:nickel superoxide dismutase
MKKRFFILAASLLMICFSFSMAAAHCQIPCGIYDDQMRTDQIAQDITTVEKAMKEISTLSRQKPVNYNQLVRWVTNKEEHASNIMNGVSLYFMAQRVNPDQKQYTEKLTVLHKLLQSAMKSKQSVDLKHVGDMRSLLKEFKSLYFNDPSDQHK